MTKMIIPVTTFNESNPLSIKSKISPKEMITEKINKFNFLRKIKFKNILTVSISAKNNDKKKNESWIRFASVREFG